MLPRPWVCHTFLELKLDKETNLYYVDAPLNLNYKSIQGLLRTKGSDSLCLLFATLGEGVDKHIAKLVEQDSSESAIFDASNIRATSRRIGLSTDASYRYERGVDFDMAELASIRACQLILATAGGEIGASRSLGVDDFLGFVDEGGNKAQCNAHHHAQLMDGHLDNLQRPHERFQTVGQRNG